MKFVQAVSGTSIRLTFERMAHIESHHPEMKNEADRLLETIASPDFVLEGDSGTLMAVRHYEKTPLTSKYCVVVYRELNGIDGFIITAYFANETAEWRKTLWKR